jgi:hypothetical protein
MCRDTLVLIDEQNDDASRSTNTLHIKKRAISSSGMDPKKTVLLSFVRNFYDLTVNHEKA